MKLRLFVLVVVLTSCKDLNLQKIDQTTLVEEELQSINWNAVDEYPSFQDCDTLTEQTTEACFKKVLIDRINTTLSEASIVVNQDISDTLKLKLLINREGGIFISDIVAKPMTYSEIPELDSLMHQSIENLPKVFPASKHGQPVTTEFQLPVVIAIQ